MPAVVTQAKAEETTRTGTAMAESHDLGPVAVARGRAGAVLGLQRAIGNRAVGGVLQRKCACGKGGGECEGCKRERESGVMQRMPLSRAPTGIQAKLAINEPGDRFEQEADRVADAVVAGAQGLSQHAGPSGHKSPVGIQRLDAGGLGNGSTASAPPIVHEALQTSGQPLEASTRAFMEPRFGSDFGDVRVHTGAMAAESAQAVNAVAYTVGRDVVFGAGRYAPATGEGRRLLAHELAHVVQQGMNGGTLQRQQGETSKAADQSQTREVVLVAEVDWLKGDTPQTAMQRALIKFGLSEKQAFQLTLRMTLSSWGNPEVGSSVAVYLPGDLVAELRKYIPVGKPIAKPIAKPIKDGPSGGITIGDTSERIDSASHVHEEKSAALTDSNSNESDTSERLSEVSSDNIDSLDTSVQESDSGPDYVKSNEEEPSNGSVSTESQADPGIVLKTADVITDFLPIVSNIKDGLRALTGIDPVTGKKLGIGERVLSAIFAIPGLGNVAKYGVKGIKYIGKALIWIVKRLNLKKMWPWIRRNAQKSWDKVLERVRRLKKPEKQSPQKQLPSSDITTTTPSALGETSISQPRVPKTAATKGEKPSKRQPTSEQNAPKQAPKLKRPSPEEFEEVVRRYPGRGGKAGWKSRADLEHTWDRHAYGTGGKPSPNPNRIPKGARSPGSEHPPVSLPPSKFPADWDLNKIAAAAVEVANSTRSSWRKMGGKNQQVTEEIFTVVGMYDKVKVHVQVLKERENVQRILTAYAP